LLQDKHFQGLLTHFLNLTKLILTLQPKHPAILILILFSEKSLEVADSVDEKDSFRSGTNYDNHMK
jgi:hypothetical protein